MTYLSDLEETRDATATALKNLNIASLNHSVDGRSFQHDSHRADLRKQLDDLNALIIKAGGTGSETTENILLG